MKASRRSRLWIVVSVVTAATISAGAFWGRSQLKAKQARAHQAAMVEQRESRLDASVEKARRVSAVDAMVVPNLWTGFNDIWRVKQWTVAAEVHGTPEQLRDELAAAYAEVHSAATAAGDARQLQRWTKEEVTARKYYGQAGELALALMQPGDAQDCFDSAAALASGDDDHAEMIRWKEKAADAAGFKGDNAGELQRRKEIETLRLKFWLADPTPALTTAKIAQCWRRGRKRETGFFMLDHFLKEFPVQIDAAHPEALFVLATHSMFLEEMGSAHLADAEMEMRETLAQCEQVYGKESPQAAIATLRLARFLFTNAKPEAESLRAEAKILCEKNFGPDHPLSTLVLSMQAMTLTKSGDMEGAQELFEQILEADEKCFLPDSLAVAGDLFQLGVTATKNARLADGQRYLRGSADIAERLAGPSFPLTILARGALAKVDELLAINPEAQVKARQALVDQAAKDPQISTAVVLNLTEEGNLQLQNANYREAEKTLRRALGLERKDPECQPLMMSLTLRCLGWCLIYLQQWTEAEADLKEALTLEEKSQGADHPDLAIVLVCLADDLFEQNRTTEAQSFLERAIKVCKPTSGPMSPNTLWALGSVGRDLCRSERFDEALSLQQLVVENTEINFGKEGINYGSALNDVANTEGLMKHLDEAERTFLQAVAIGEKLPPGNLNVAEWQANLACCYVVQHKMHEAEPWFRKSILNLMHAAKEVGKDSPNLKTYLELYSNHLQEMGLSEEKITERIDHLRKGESVPDL